MTHESKGGVKLSAAVFSDPRVRELPGDCFRVFLWMSMEAAGGPGSDATVRASASSVARAVGLADSSVCRAFTRLLQGGLIQRVETNFKTGNLWKVVPLLVVEAVPS